MRKTFNMFPLVFAFSKNPECTLSSSRSLKVSDEYSYSWGTVVKSDVQERACSQVWKILKFMLCCGPTQAFWRWVRQLPLDENLWIQTCEIHLHCLKCTRPWQKKGTRLTISGMETSDPLQSAVWSEHYCDHMLSVLVISEHCDRDQSLYSQLQLNTWLSSTRAQCVSNGERGIHGYMGTHRFSSRSTKLE